MTIGPYSTWLFDCDGVLLDSNAVKTEAFHALALPFGEDVADALVTHHRQQGGVSRFVKVRYLYEELLDRCGAEEEIEAGIREYGRLVKERLLVCPETPGLREFLDRLPEGTYRAVISGGLEEEVRHVLQVRGLSSYFDAIYGSPRTKGEVFTEIGHTRPLGREAVYLGDSRYDFEVAKQFGMDFIFVSGHTEFEGWRSYFEDEVPVVDWLSCINTK
ncbi:MAG: HAD hydrolase-like protein [Rhodothermales bacterium]|uniref:HAD family hydrolase n=1 Tax=Roseibium sp. TaxID=1936156 RepID=UPI0032955B68